MLLTTPRLELVVGERGSVAVLSESVRDFSRLTVMAVCLGEVSGRAKMIKIKMSPP